MNTHAIRSYVFLVLILSVVLTVIAQLVTKAGINEMSVAKGPTDLVRRYLMMFSSAKVLIGALIYAVSVLLYLYVLSVADLSYAYPIAASSYALVAVGCWVFLGEGISLLRWIGIGIIFLGVIVISRS